MQWWCSAQGVAWDWSWQPYPGVWLFVLAVAGLYVRIRRSGDAAADEDSPRMRRWRTAAGVAGIVVLWLALDWPVGALGAGYLASVHMAQYLLIALAAPALLLLGVPPAAYERLARRPVLGGGIRQATRPAVALLVFIAVTLVTHVPGVVDTLMRSQTGSFAIDAAWLLAGLLFWWPIVVPVPARPHFPPPLQVLYLFPAMLTHTAISVYMVFSRYPLYATYELAPPTGWVTALADQQIAGGLMWVTVTPIMWSIIGVVFFRWLGSEPMPAEAGAPDPSARPAPR
jgi:cytochrome c oxidase assembly factor CtaG